MGGLEGPRPGCFLRNIRLFITLHYITLHYITLHYITLRGTIFIHARGVIIITVVHTFIPRKAQSASIISANNTWDVLYWAFLVLHVAASEWGA